MCMKRKAVKIRLLGPSTAEGARAQKLCSKCEPAPARNK